MTDITMTTRIEPRGPAGGLVLTDAQVEELGGGRRATVRVRIGERSARLRLAVMGGENLVGMSKAARAELGVEVGDEVTATVALDEAPREVEVPPELAAALADDADAAAAFAALSFTRRKEIATGIADAKRPATKASRLDAALQALRA